MMIVFDVSPGPDKPGFVQLWSKSSGFSGENESEISESEKRFKSKM